MITGAEPFAVASGWEESGSGIQRADSSRGRVGAHSKGALAADLHVSNVGRYQDEQHTALVGEGRRLRPARPPAASVRRVPVRPRPPAGISWRAAETWSIPLEALATYLLVPGLPGLLPRPCRLT